MGTLSKSRRPNSTARLLLLELLLHQDLVLNVHERLEDVGVEHRGPDVAEFDLQEIEVVVETCGEHFVDRTKFEFRQETARELFGVVAEAPRRHAGELRRE